MSTLACRFLSTTSPWRVLSIATLAIVLVSCGWEDNPRASATASSSPALGQMEAPQAASIQGSLNIAPLASLSLSIVSPYGSASVGGSGNFADLPAVDSGLDQLLVIELANGDAIAMANLPAADVQMGQATIDLEAIALGYIRMNPLLIGMGVDDERQLLAHAQSLAEFQTLVADINTALMTDPASLRDFTASKGIFDGAISVGLQAYEEHFQTANAGRTKATIGEGAKLEVLDQSGQSIGVSNGTQVFYGYQIASSGAGVIVDDLLPGRDGALTIDAGLPPVISTAPMVESLDLEDGDYVARFYKGFNRSDPLFAFDHAAGKATWANTLKLISMGLRLCGLSAGLDGASNFAMDDATIEALVALEDLADGLDIDALVDSVNMQTWDQVVSSVMDVLQVEEHWTQLALWLWGPRALSRNGVSEVSRFARNIRFFAPVLAQSLREASPVKARVPFAYDLFTEPAQVEYEFSSTNGVLSPLNMMVDVPTLLITEELETFHAPAIGELSAVQSYQVAGIALTGDITATSDSEQILLSLSEADGFSRSVTFTPSGSQFTPTTLYLRLDPTQTGEQSATIWHSSAGAAASSMTVNASVYQRNPGVWTNISSTGAPSARGNHTAVWTGSEMIIWGGHSSASPGTQDAALGDGAAYDPATDTWRSISSTGAPIARFGHSAVWTGSEMIIWGGRMYTMAGSWNYLSDGGAYDPLSDTWRSISTVDAPLERSDHTAVWTGSEMVIWEGSIGYPDDVSRAYDPNTDAWRSISIDDMMPAPIERSHHMAVYTGSEMIVWGGLWRSYRDEGGAWDSVNDSWRYIAPADGIAARYSGSAAWTGSEMIIWGGLGTEDSGDTGIAYNPLTDSWRNIPADGVPNARREHSAVWTGSQMIIWGGLGFGEGSTPPEYFDSGFMGTP